MKQDFKVYIRLISYLKPYWGIALLVLIGFGLNAATEVSVAKLLKYIIDAIQLGSREDLDWFPLLIVLLVFFRGLGLFMGGYYTAVISRRLILVFDKKFMPNLCVCPRSTISTIPLGISLPRSCTTSSNSRQLPLNH